MEVSAGIETEEKGLPVAESSAKKPKREAKEHYDEIKRDNAIFSEYYRKQELVPEEEWPLLMTSLATPLPTTFRLTGHRAEEAQNTRRQFLAHAEHLGDRVKCLDWYEPQGMAWHLDLDRKRIRTDAQVESLHNWMVAATENGDISRQEAVSMIPPLFMDIKRDHLVLDMCAAPGSKTAQLVEQMHADVANADDGKGLPTGMVIANDSDQQRAYMLYHQVKRILSPCLLVTNNDGTTFPTLVEKRPQSTYSRVLFDRILADVPCSGDGTLRKNALLWKTWTPNHALGLHPLQIRLLEKAIRLLMVGGRMVYSTCSLNFVENEAVVAHVLSKYSHALRLVDVSDQLASLQRRPGRSSWKVLNKEGEEYESFEAVPSDQKRRFPASLFPKSSYSELGLERCLRVYPHLQNTGGFFVAVIEKHGEIDVRSDEASRETAAPVAPKGGKKSFFKAPAEGEFRQLDIATDPTLLSIFDCYGIDGDAMAAAGFGLFVRSERVPIKSIIVTSPQTERILSATVRSHVTTPAPASEDSASASATTEGASTCYNSSLKIVNAGVRAFEVYESGSRAIPVSCVYRPLFESLTVMRPLMTKRTGTVSRDQMRSLLSSNDSIRIPEIEEQFGQGGAVLETTRPEGNSGLPVVIPVWVSERGVKAFVAQTNKPALLMQLQ